MCMYSIFINVCIKYVYKCHINKIFISRSVTMAAIVTCQSVRLVASEIAVSKIISLCNLQWQSYHFRPVKRNHTKYHKVVTKSYWLLLIHIVFPQEAQNVAGDQFPYIAQIAWSVPASSSFAVWDADGCSRCSSARAVSIATRAFMSHFSGIRGLYAFIIFYCITSIYCNSMMTYPRLHRAKISCESPSGKGRLMVHRRKVWMRNCGVAGRGGL